jgi:hypothetical protein
MNSVYGKYVKELPYKIKLNTIFFKNTEIDKKTALEEVKT